MTDSTAIQSSHMGLPCETHFFQAKTAGFRTESRVILTAETGCTSPLWVTRRACSGRDWGV
jgi:hypothetical protein